MSPNQRTLLVSAQEDFEFPLAEAARKQIMALAEHGCDEGQDVEIMIVTPGRSVQVTRGGIPIREIPKRRLLAHGRYVRSFDAVHYLGAIGLIALAVALLAPAVPKTFTATDGGVFSTGSRAGARRLLARCFHRFYDRFQTYTRHQRRLLLAASRRYEPKLTTISPLLVDPLMPQAETKRTGLLYLGHLSYFKGLDIVMRVFSELAAEMPDITLTIAANGLSYGDSLEGEVNRLVDSYPGRVRVKGKIDVYDELSRARLLLYPIRSQVGTFAVPLSLYESLICGTPFLCSQLDGVDEYFDDFFLCRAGDVAHFLSRARQLLSAPEECRAHIEKNLQRIKESCRRHEPCC